MDTDPANQTNPAKEMPAGKTPEKQPAELLTGTGGDGAPLDPAKEETLWTGRTHWKHFFGLVAIGFIIVVICIVLVAKIGSSAETTGLTMFYIDAIIAVAVIVCVGGWMLLRILSNRYRLTQQRLFIERGILSQTIDQTELIRVDDIRVTKKIVDRIFGLGSIEVISTDASDSSLIIEGVKGADEVAERIRNCMRTLRSQSLFVERL